MTSFLPLCEPDALPGGSSDDWYTPAWILQLVGRFWPEGIDLDPCWHPASLVKAKQTYTREQNGLAHRWTGKVWCNPPYSSPGDWVVKARASASKGAEVLQLLKFDPSTRWFQEIWRDAASIAVFRRRLQFISGNDAKPTSANFPSCVVLWSSAANLLCFNSEFSKHAQIIHWFDRT